MGFNSVFKGLSYGQDGVFFSKTIQTDYKARPASSSTDTGVKAAKA